MEEFRRPKPNRKDKKQISFFTTDELHESIKSAADNRKKTIKDYILDLHLKEESGNLSDSDKIDDILENVLQLNAKISGDSAPKSRRSSSSSMSPVTEPIAEFSDALNEIVLGMTPVNSQISAMEVLKAIVEGNHTNSEISSHRGTGSTSTLKRLTEIGIVRLVEEGEGRAHKYYISQSYE